MIPAPCIYMYVHVCSHKEKSMLSIINQVKQFNHCKTGSRMNCQLHHKYMYPLRCLLLTFHVPLKYSLSVGGIGLKFANREFYS